MKLSLLGLLALSSRAVYADEVEDIEIEDEEDLDLEDLILEDEEGLGDYQIEDSEGGPSFDVATTFLYPEHDEPYTFTINEQSTILVHFANEGTRTFNVTGIGAHLHSPYDLSYYIANFTARPVGEIVGPSAELTLDYSFSAGSLEPVEFWFSVWVSYNDAAGREYVSTVFNNTIQLVDGPTKYTFEDFVSYGSWLIMAAGAYYFYTKEGNPFATKKQKAQRAREIAAQAPTTPTEAAPEVVAYSQAEKSRSRKKRR